MTKITVLARAEWDLDDWQEHFEAQEFDPDLGEKFLLAFDQGVERIRQFPRGYGKYWRDVRICPLHPFKIGVFYRVVREFVYILRVLDLRRDPRRLRRELGD